MSKTTCFPLTERELRVLGFATWMMMRESYRKSDDCLRYRPPGVDGEKAKRDSDAFLKDAKDAEALVARLRDALRVTTDGGTPMEEDE